MIPARRITRPATFVTALVALLAVLSASAASQPDTLDSPLVAADLVADVHSIQPGTPFHVGVRLRIADGWHVNWINPGDAGLAPSVDWQLGDGFSVEPGQWPHPYRYLTGPLAIFGYENTVTLWSTVTPPPQLDPGEEVTLAADVDWLACEEACVPGRTPVTLELPVETTVRVDHETARLLEENRRRVPVSPQGWSLEARYTEHEIEIHIDPVVPGDVPVPTGVFFFPDTPGIIENAAPQRLEPGGTGTRLLVPRSRMVRELPPRLTGVLVARTGWGEGGPPALQVDIPLQPR